MVFEAGIVDNVSEACFSDFPVPNMSVPIHARAEAGLRIVQMEGHNLLQPNQGSDFPNGRVPTFAWADVIAGRKEMGGIKANAQALRFLHAVVNGGEVLHCMTQAGPL